MDIYIKNLHPNLDEDHLKILFEPFGALISTHVSRNSVTGRSKGFGFVKMHHDLDALRAIDDLNGRELAGRVLTVSEAKSKEQEVNYNSSGNGERLRPQKYHKPRIFNEDRWDSRTVVENNYPNEKIDLEVKEEVGFSKEVLKDGFVQIKFKK